RETTSPGASAGTSDAIALSQCTTMRRMTDLVLPERDTWTRTDMRSRYRYIGDYGTRLELRFKEVRGVRDRRTGSMVKGRDGNVLIVTENGTRVVVPGRLLRRIRRPNGSKASHSERKGLE